MNLRVVAREAEEGGYWAEVPAIPGCVSQAETLNELRKNIHEAIEGCLPVPAVRPACIVAVRVGFGVRK